MFKENKIFNLMRLLGVYIILGPLLFAQSVSFNNFTTDNGLSNNKINDVIQDNTGFIWLATDDGLNRFDGYNFKVFKNNPNNKFSLSDNTVNALFEDKSENIWIGTKSGELNRYNPFTEKFDHWTINSSLVNENTITEIIVDSKGAVWIGTYSSGLYRFDPKNNKIENWVNTSQNPSILTNGYITSLVEDSKGNILVGTYVGLNIIKYENSKAYIEHYFFDSAPQRASVNNIIWSISISDLGQDLFWIGTANGLVKFNSVERTFSKIKISNPLNLKFGAAAGTVIEEPEKKLLWIDSYEGLIKLNLITNEQVRYLEDKDRPKHLINNQINKIVKDRSGVIWIATQNGLSSFSTLAGRFNSVEEDDFSGLNSLLLKNKNVTAMIQTKDSTLWIGTTEGLYYNEKTGKKSKLQKINGTEKINIWSLASDSNYNIWLGTYGSGLIKLNGRNKRQDMIKLSHPYLSTQSILFNKSLLIDNENLWIGFWGLGLARLNIKNNRLAVMQNKRDTKQEGISHNDVWVIYKDKKGRLWIGTNGGGLNLLLDSENGIFIHWVVDENNINSLSSNSIYSITESTRGQLSVDKRKSHLWIGTNNGLNKFEIDETSLLSNSKKMQVNITKFTTSDGLADNTINSILEDDNGNLWLATNSGISFFDVEQNTFTNFNKSHGLISGVFNTGAALKTSDGKMIFGGTFGLNIFNPNQISLSSYLPKIVITNLLIFNEPINAGVNSPLFKSISKSDSLFLSYNQNVFSFEFAALDFNSPQSIKYAYKMEGFDNEWIESGSRRYVTYTNLSPGEYTFNVKSTNADGVWQNNISQLKIIISSPWWATGWAYSLYVLVILVGLYVIRRFELNRTRLKNILKMREYEAIKQKELDETKSRFFANLSHEFRTPLMLIKGPLEQLIEDKSNEKNIERYKMIHRNTENLQTLIDQLLELTQLEAASMPLRAKKQDLINHIMGIVASFKSLADEKNITLSFKKVEDPLIAWIDTDKLEKIINNLLSNALKFTPEGGAISIKIFKKILDENEYAEITISDTGIGIPKAKLDKIFDRFYQVDDSIQRAFGGSGIGLALVKELVELHRWEISVISELNKGSEFILKIPLSDDYLDEDQKLKSIIINDSVNRKTTYEFDEEEGFEKTLEEVEDITKPSILIVEDSSDVRLYLMDLLKTDYNLLEAANGREGINLAKEKMPDLIISDVMMPEMDGMEFCSNIKSDFLTCHIPIIMLTAKASGESKIQGLETGADDYLTKPFNSRELFVRIKNLLEQRKLLREKFSKEVNPEPKSITSNPLDEEFLQKAFSLAEKNLDNSNFDTEAFAKEMFFSRMQLHRKLQAITGQTPGDFIRTFRLKRAAQFLKEKKLSITQVAFAVGYNSPSQFSRAFSKQFNCTPSEYSNK